MNNKTTTDLDKLCNDALKMLYKICDTVPGVSDMMKTSCDEFRSRKAALDDQPTMKESVENINRVRRLSGIKMLSPDEVAAIQEGSNQVDSTILADKRAMFKNMGINISESKLRELCTKSSILTESDTPVAVLDRVEQCRQQGGMDIKDPTGESCVLDCEMDDDGECVWTHSITGDTFTTDEVQSCARIDPETNETHFDY